VDHAEVHIIVQWDKPANPSGETPPGLVGYYVYRNNIKSGFVNDPDRLEWFDYDPNPGTYFYKATAYYDLSAYGSPGQFAESPFSNSDTIKQWFTKILPIDEDWSSVSFNFNDWKFAPSQGNWDITVRDGNPLPTAIFFGIPELNDFDCGFYTKPLYHQFPCGRYFVEFDLKMDALVPGDSNQFFFDVYYDSTWTTRAVYNNVSTDGWVHYRYDINEFTGSFFRVRFQAAGTSSSGINSWMLDNILIDGTCATPDTIGYRLTGNKVTFYWGKPCKDTDKPQMLFGYDVFRTDSSGYPPYVRLNEEHITDTFYVDSIPTGMLKGKFRYCMRAIYYECWSDTSASILVSPSLGISEPQGSSIRIFPNPANELLQITSDIPIEALTLWSASGVVQSQLRDLNDRKVIVPVKNYSEGIYSVGISTNDSFIIMKVIILH